MLTDIERKVLRILYNDTRFGGRVPSIIKLAVRTGKDPDMLSRVLRSLADKGFIDWSSDRHEQLQVVKAWEEHHAPAPSKSVASTEYWDRGF